jgi:hypothetical protein
MGFAKQCERKGPTRAYGENVIGKLVSAAGGNASQAAQEHFRTDHESGSNEQTPTDPHCNARGVIKKSDDLVESFANPCAHYGWSFMLFRSAAAAYTLCIIYQR